MQKYSPMDIARFWSKAEVGGPSACWHWKGAAKPGSYGNFFVGGEYRNAHRVAYEIFHGTDLGEAWACHHCDNKQCVNPLHIYVGDLQTNTADAQERGKFLRPDRDFHGERNPNHKLRAEDVGQIKRMLIDGAKGRAIAKQFDVSEYTISLIKLGKVWAHIQPGGFDEPRSRP